MTTPVPEMQDLLYVMYIRHVHVGLAVLSRLAARVVSATFGGSSAPKPSLRLMSCHIQTAIDMGNGKQRQTTLPQLTRTPSDRSWPAYQSINWRRNPTIAQSRRTKRRTSDRQVFACSGLVAFDAEQKHRQQHSRDDSTHGRAAKKRLGRSRH
jgi:hypothetical protein